MANKNFLDEQGVVTLSKEIFLRLKSFVGGTIVNELSASSDDKHSVSAKKVYEIYQELKNATSGISPETSQKITKLENDLLQLTGRVDAIKSFTAKVHIGELTNIGVPDENAIYYHKATNQETNWNISVYATYKGIKQWLTIGSFNIDMSNYWSKSETDQLKNALNLPNMNQYWKKSEVNELKNVLDLSNYWAKTETPALKAALDLPTFRGLTLSEIKARIEEVKAELQLSPPGPGGGGTGGNLDPAKIAEIEGKIEQLKTDLSNLRSIVGSIDNEAVKHELNTKMDDIFNELDNKIDKKISDLTDQVDYTTNKFENEFNEYAEYIRRRIGKIYTVRIDTENPDPTSSIVYMDNAIRYEPGIDKWDKLFGYYPVLVKNGTVVAKLNENNFHLKKDGTSLTADELNTCDIMICFPYMGYRIQNRGRYLYVSITKDHLEGFCYEPFKIGNIYYNNLYIASCVGNLSKYQDLSSVHLVRKNKIKEYLSRKASNYKYLGIYQLSLLQCLFILKYKTLNYRSYFPVVKKYKLIDTNDTYHLLNKGMFYKSGNNPEVDVSKVFGICNLCNTVGFYLNGLKSYSIGREVKEIYSYDNENNSIILRNVDIIGGPIQKVIGINDGGFLPLDFEGASIATENTFFCSYIMTYTGSKTNPVSNHVCCSSFNSNDAGYSNIFSLAEPHIDLGNNENGAYVLMTLLSNN